MSTIVFGFTLTPEGAAALEVAISEARRRSARLAVVHSRREGHERDIEDMQRYDEALAEIGTRLVNEGIEHSVHDFIQGNRPAEDIVGLARETNAELIVIGMRHRTRTGKFLLGSTAQDILLDAPCPVMAVKSPSPPD